MPWEKQPFREAPQILEDEIGSRVAPSVNKESLILQSRRGIAIEVAVVIVISEVIYLALPGDLLFPGFVAPKKMQRPPKRPNADAEIGVCVGFLAKKSLRAEQGVPPSKGSPGHPEDPLPHGDLWRASWWHGGLTPSDVRPAPTVIGHARKGPPGVSAWIWKTLPG